MHADAGLRTLPNLISSSRVILAAAFVAANGARTRLAIVIVAGLTDFLDGWVARRANAASRLGALVDPIADRVFVLVAVSTFLFEGTLTTLGYFVMISRDIMTAVGFLVAKTVSWLRPVQFKARLSGKLVTGLQLATLVALLATPSLANALLWAVGIASVLAVVDYTYALWRARARAA
jgi:phosphatidylglycerophosphate synthase